MEQAALRDVMANAVASVFEAYAIPSFRDAWYSEYWQKKRERSSNPIVRAGARYFSQGDEDGLLLEILRRLSIEHGTFVEFGVGNGLENNTLLLLMAGWSGAWIGGEALAFQVPPQGPLHFQQAWITQDNAYQLYAAAVGGLGIAQPTVLSVDLDGNDLYIIEALLAHDVAPDVLIAEYNGKFPPPIRWSVQYDPNHHWDNSDYMGASLQSLVDLATRYGYRLVCCGVTGTNAFFVRDGAANFEDVPTRAADLFMPPDYCWFSRVGHPTSAKTVLQALNAGPLAP